MTADDLQSAAHRIVEAMVRDFPTEAATIGALVLTEIMAAGLHGGGDPDATDAFVAAINWKRRDRRASRRRSRVAARTL